MGPHQRSKLFDTQIIYLQRKWMETVDFLQYINGKDLDSPERDTPRSNPELQVSDI